MTKKIPYIIALILLPIIIYFNTWQNISLFLIVLGYTVYTEYMDKKEEIKEFRNEINMLKEDIKLLNERTIDMKNKLTFQVMGTPTKKIGG